ncbi:MAG TPA: hypothetical protein VK841_22475 [Polyangiaceae bacterium]|jgi:hypothetical protein|nr:hypothetical protein [Polyangiaceae bacterium]
MHTGKSFIAKNDDLVTVAHGHGPDVGPGLIAVTVSRTRRAGRPTWGGKPEVVEDPARVAHAHLSATDARELATLLNTLADEAEASAAPGASQ